MLNVARLTIYSPCGLSGTFQTLMNVPCDVIKEWPFFRFVECIANRHLLNITTIVFTKPLQSISRRQFCQDHFSLMNLKLGMNMGQGNLRRLNRSKKTHQKFIVIGQIIGSGKINSFMWMKSILYNRFFIQISELNRILDRKNI